jgi:hypothetical protein
LRNDDCICWNRKNESRISLSLTHFFLRAADQKTLSTALLILKVTFVILTILLIY